MNTIKFEYITANFKVISGKNLFRRFVAFILHHQTAFETIARTGQPFGGKVF
ncbi:hypothetical protein [Runella sp.]|jgi:hypothetical protein|uniref:hypothetical protein n=1 Tax=Runella sp. TaxID=1960881 RepID=UPI002639F39A|nr:hypothetical protein [Runella sp.]